MTVYNAHKFYTLPILIFPLLLLIPLVTEGNSASPQEWFGFSIFTIFTLLTFFVPFGLQIRIDSNSVESYFFGRCIRIIRPGDVQSVVYRNLFLGGFGLGKALFIYCYVKGNSRRFSIGEGLYGKEAVAHVRTVLEPHL